MHQRRFNPCVVGGGEGRLSVVCVWNQVGIGDGNMGEFGELHQRGVGEGLYVGMEERGVAASITSLRLM